MKKEIKIFFKTITPLWTGDAWGENNTIRPSGLIGSLRFWFEVICFFSGITNKTNYENGKLKDELKEKVNNKKVSDFFVKNGNDFSGIDKTLAEMGISLPSRIFGCTGWKGWIKIKEIENIQEAKNYTFLIGKLEFEELKYGKEYFNKKTNKKDKKEIIPAWYFNKGFQGKFELIFELEEEILKPIFFPLLTFMEKYGFWGGKWNIGYGRLKVEKVKLKNNSYFEEINNWRNDEFGFSGFFKDKDSKFESKKFSDFIDNNNSLNKDSNLFDFLKCFLEVDSFFCKSERNFQEKIRNVPSKFKTIVNLINDNDSDYKNIIKELIKTKSQIRDCLRPRTSIQNKKVWDDFRHELLGTTSGGAEGTKIIPWIYEENGQLKGGFISIAGVLNLVKKD